MSNSKSKDFQAETNKINEKVKNSIIIENKKIINKKMKLPKKVLSDEEKIQRIQKNIHLTNLIPKKQTNIIISWHQEKTAQPAKREPSPYHKHRRTLVIPPPDYAE